MKNLRLKFLLFVIAFAQKNYRRFFKRKKRQWTFTEEQLLYFQADSLGRKLGEFYKTHGFRMIPKYENHDVHHLLTSYGTKMPEEIAMQYLLLGNGKRSAYLLGAITFGTFVYPEHFKMYLNAFRKGRKMITFHHWNFEEMLDKNVHSLKELIFNDPIQTHTILYNLKSVI